MNICALLVPAIISLLSNFGNLPSINTRTETPIRAAMFSVWRKLFFSGPATSSLTSPSPPRHRCKQPPVHQSASNLAPGRPELYESERTSFQPPHSGSENRVLVGCVISLVALALLALVIGTVVAVAVAEMHNNVPSLSQ